MKARNTVIATILAAILILAWQTSFAQFDIKGKVQRKTDEKIDEKIDEGVDNTIDGIFNKKEKTEKEKTEEVEETVEEDVVGSETEEVETETEEKENPVKPDDKPKMESYTKYDFIPGDQIIYFDDFSQDAIGDFPANWTTNSSGEVKTINLFPGKWFHLNGDNAVYNYTKQIAFPENFIMEFDIVPDANYYGGIHLLFYQEEIYTELNAESYPGQQGFYLTLGPAQWWAKGYTNLTEAIWPEASSEKNMVEKEKLNHVIIWVQNRRVRVYHQGAKVLDLPTLIFSGTKLNRFEFSGWGTESYPYISNLKITTAAPDMRSKLLTEGKLISYGIYFDSGKDLVKPESYGSLKEIAAVLTENPTVRISIVGHTDSDGDDAMNLDLSKRRAAGVKNSLVKDFGISADRIETDGKGESVPLAPNTSVENKAKNRRVEFIKL
jgi:outer membrane protein OmpA-like peptidoglycan-associated protein